MKSLFLWLTIPLFFLREDIPPQLLEFKTNKQIPERIEVQVLTALSHYPQLKNTDIRFVFNENLDGPIMAARPVVGSLLGGRSKRAYNILINPTFKLKHLEEPIDDIPDSVLIGWLGHELGHIMDYENRSTLGVMRFGVGYWLSSKYIRKAERVADTYAIQHGMGDYILVNKEFILGHADLPQHYKDRIARLYLSPDDIMDLILELEGETREEQEEILAEEEDMQQEMEEEPVETTGD